MALNRIYEMIIASASDTTGVSGITPGQHTPLEQSSIVVNSGLDVSALDIEFNIMRSMTSAENHADFNIFNMQKKSRDFTEQPGLNILFKAGYQDEGPASIVFIGNINTSVSIRKFPNWETKIDAITMLSQGKDITNSYIPLSYSKNTLIQTVLEAISVSMGYNILGLELVAGMTLSNGYVFAGSQNAALKDMAVRLKHSGIEMYIDNSEIVLYKVGSAVSTFGIVSLDYESGLLEAHNLNEKNPQEPAPKITGFVPGKQIEATNAGKKIQFKSLIIPQLRPGGLVNINVNDKTVVSGKYYVTKVNFTGNNFGGDSYAQCEAEGPAVGT